MAKKKTAALPKKPKKAAGGAAPVPVENLTHADKRTNIPTRETAGFTRDEKPKKVLYARDPSLDPQLVWKGKDEQDAQPLSVPAVPIYVQEKIHPRAIIEDLKGRAAEARRVDAAPLANLFADFNGLDDFAKKLEFYQHDQHWTNRMILGDSLLVMTSLAEKERLRGKVQCIYFDPPYGIKFGSNWQVSTRKRDVKDAKAEDLTRQPEQIKAFRDTWELGIHSYLTYLRDRLTAARDLLTESGSIFVQIGDENVHLVRNIMDEVLGSDNFVSLITFFKSGSQTTDLLPNMGDYILWFAKDIQQVKRRPAWYHKLEGRSAEDVYRHVLLPTGERRNLTNEESEDQSTLPDGSKVYRLSSMTSASGSSTTQYTYKLNGKEFSVPRGGWRVTKEGMDRLVIADRVTPSGSTIACYKYIDDFPLSPHGNIWLDTGTGSFTDPKVYVVQTGVKVIQRCLLMTTDPGDLVLDPTCGSGTTAYVAEQWGRRWITIDTSRVALALARTRLMAGRFPYYLLADTPEGQRKLAELSNEKLTLNPQSEIRNPQFPDVRRGFVYKTVPHVTLKSIANNPDIREGMSRAEIDAAIAKHAETETLFDQPYEDKGIVRVAGPFTVESLSPHRELPNPGAAENPPADAGGSPAEESYVPMILDNLRKAGVKGMTKDQRIAFERLDLLPGEYLQAEGLTDAGAAVRVSIGPEFGTIGDDWIKKAALEAVKGSRCDLLLVCGFAFDAGVLEQTAELKKEMQFGKLRIQPVRMNPDLAMGDELLKKTGAGNLFTVFGEPDLKIEKVAGRAASAPGYTVTIQGLDVFDPTTGEVRTGGTDDIACWFIDTDYDGQSFFVRHAYFCGSGDPYQRLKKALKAEIDEAEWSKLYSTTSIPFPAPKSGKIAVKVINHFGDEVLKVYQVK